MLDWFSGSVTEAISAYQEKKGLLIVYIHHSEEENNGNTINFNGLWEKFDVKMFESIPLIAIRIQKDSVGAKQFAEFFPTPIFPVCYLLGLNGQPLEVITPAEEKMSEQKLRDSLRKGIRFYYDQLREQGLPVPSEAEGLTIGSSSNAPVEYLTEEEQAERVKQVRDRLEQKRKEDAEKKKEEERKKELERRNEGKMLLDARDRNKEREMLESIEARRKEKESDAASLKRIREQIKLDNEERKKKASGRVDPDPAESKAELVESKPQAVVQSDECRIQCKFPNGSTLIKTFPSASPLQAVIDAVKEDGRVNGPFILVQAFPRQQLTENEKTLLELSLTPSSALLVVPDDNQTFKGRQDVIANGNGYFNLLLGFLYTPVVAILRFIVSLFNFRTGAPAAQQPEGTTNGSAQNERKDSKPSSRPSPRTRREGNIARLRNSDDSSDDNEATWNGNSTQQL